MTRSEEKDRALLLGFLKGVRTFEQEPWLLDDDVLFFAARAVAAKDPRWLLAELGKREYSPALREIVARNAFGPDVRQALEIIARTTETEPQERARTLFRIRLQGDEQRACTFSEGEVTIGRAPECTLSVSSYGCSQRHAKVTVREGRAWLTDMKSKGGTHVNGVPVVEKELRDGDVFRCGMVFFTFEVDRFSPDLAAMSMGTPGGQGGGEALIDTPRILQLLREWRLSGNMTTRAQAGAELDRLGPAAIPALVAALGDEDVRHGAADRLLGSGEAAVPALIESLKAPGRGRADASQVLGRIGPAAAAAAPVLLSLLDDPEEKLRVESLGALRYIQPPASELVAALVPLLNRRGESVRLAAVWALAGAGAEARAVVPALVRIVAWDEDESLRQSAAGTLGAIGPEGVAGLEEQARAAGVRMWYLEEYDSFGFADDRDPPRTVSIHLSRAGAEGCRSGRRKTHRSCTIPSSKRTSRSS